VIILHIKNIFSDTSNFKSSFGFGPRFFIYKNKRTLLRLDIGVNDEDGSGIYFGVNEAFWGLYQQAQVWRTWFPH